MSDNIERIAVFDFDGTLYKKNSILSFCYFYYCKKPLRLWRIFMQLFAWGLWKTKRINTTIFKARFICFIASDSFGEVERMAILFWENRASFNEEILLALKRCQSDSLCPVVISASPDLFILPACKKLGIKYLIATKLLIQNGSYSLGKNCRGLEKITRLKEVFPTQTVAIAYSDNNDDLPLLRSADHGFIVKNGCITCKG